MLTYLDSGVLIAAAKGEPRLGERAMRVIDDSSRTFIASPFLRLETLHRTSFAGYQTQAEFYRVFFAAAHVRFEDAGRAVGRAEEIVAAYGLDGLDAMHVAAAVLAGADEFITTEKEQQKMHRASPLVPIRYLLQV